MNDTILQSVKKMLGLASDYTPFDTDILVHINGVFFILKQLGLGITSNSSVTSDATWNELLDRPELFELVRSYVYLKVRLLFDPPSSSSVMDAIKSQISECEWRLNAEAEEVNDGE